MAKLEYEIRQFDYRIWFLNHFKVSPTSHSISYYKSRGKAEKAVIPFLRKGLYSSLESRQLLHCELKESARTHLFVIIEIENFRCRPYLEVLHFINEDFEARNIHCPNIWMDGLLLRAVIGLQSCVIPYNIVSLLEHYRKKKK